MAKLVTTAAVYNYCTGSYYYYNCAGVGDGLCVSIFIKGYLFFV